MRIYQTQKLVQSKGMINLANMQPEELDKMFQKQAINFYNI